MWRQKFAPNKIGQSWQIRQGKTNVHMCVKCEQILSKKIMKKSQCVSFSDFSLVY